MAWNKFGGELSVTKIFEFCYAHKLPKYKGKCSNVHGHSGVLHVELNTAVKGHYQYNGMIIDFNELKKVVNREIIDVLDHKFLNEDMEHFNKVNPTAENITMWVVAKLQKIFGRALVRVRVYETPTSYAEWVYMG